ncbi:DUF6146 family protein [Croceivirga sp. JEA036]|uniref:DUF6146 family protein n=1 Tax=Croceivirga sp. JEA036 TaxID=2721162 RepID=UPI001438FAA5|nr:DUF6146 family protein [Croceivirga sp. JEA036]NJB35542.1 hypothetical protein [Croceivirga sp. JEA036]
MKKSVLVFLSLILFSCGATKEQMVISNEEKQILESTEEQEVAISDEESEYEIIIIEPGFYTWLNSIARPEGYYSQSFLENRNQIYVINWNQRVMNPSVYNPNLYELQINYDPNIDYGYDVNYKLYNYFIFFQRKYNQRLGPFVPRI